MSSLVQTIFPWLTGNEPTVSAAIAQQIKSGNDSIPSPAMVRNTPTSRGSWGITVFEYTPGNANLPDGLWTQTKALPCQLPNAGTRREGFALALRTA